MRVVTGDGLLALDLDPSTGGISSMSLGSNPSSGAHEDQSHHSVGSGGFALREYLAGDAPCDMNRGATNVLTNGDFSAPGNSPATAAQWTVALKGLGYKRETGAAATRENHTASISVTTTRPTDVGGAAQVWTPVGRKQYSQLKLSGWSKADADSGGAAIDYSIYADVSFVDGSWTFGHTAKFNPSANDWEYACTVIELDEDKPILAVYVYALYRNRVGRVFFDSLLLAPLEATPLADGSASPGAQNNSLFVAGTFAPSSWVSELYQQINRISRLLTDPNHILYPLNFIRWILSQESGNGAALTATFTGHDDHIRVDGAVALERANGTRSSVNSTLSSVNGTLSSANGTVSSANSTLSSTPPPDRAVSLRLGLPLDGNGWRLWSDANTFVTLDSNSSTYSGQVQPHYTAHLLPIGIC
jgi:hypothetical protein